MASPDPAAVLAWYQDSATAWAAARRAGASPQLAGFLARLPVGARVLELGCGAGEDAQAMLAAGFDVTPTDGSPAMAQLAAERLGRAVQVLTFDRLEAEGVFDAIWANACLLHVPRADLVAVLARIHRALKPGGLHYASYKSGLAEGEDRFGRFYNYPTLSELQAIVASSADWRMIGAEEWRGGQHGGGETGWIGLTLRRPAGTSAEDQPGHYGPETQR